MFITQLLENPQEPSIVVIYAGRFQPFHKGHHAVFNWLSGRYGRNNVFIATSNKTDALKSPFTFSEKAYFMNLTGVPADRIVESAQPYRADEIVKNYNPQTTLLLFAVSEKDMAEDPRFKVGAKKDGSLSYFQHLPQNLRDAKTLNEHAYLVVTPKFDFAVLGQPMDSASQIRSMYSQSDDATRKQIIADLFGKYTPEAQQIMDNKLGAAQQEAIESPKVGKMYEDEEGTELRTANLIRKARVAHPLAQSDDQALVMYALDKEQKDVAELGQEEMDIEAEIAKLKADIAELKRKQPVTEAGVGLVRAGKDPRYVMATTGDQNDVNSKTLGNMMKAYKLVGQKAPKTGQSQVKSNIAESVEDISRAICHRIMMQHTDLLSQFGPKAIMDAADEVAEWYGDDWDELGSSDISAMVKSVMRTLGVEEAQPKTVEEKLMAQFESFRVTETPLNPLDPKGDYRAKRKALQDIQLDPDTGKDPDLTAELIRRKASLDKEARDAGIVENSFRDDEFRNRERNAGLEHETNNIAIAINGKTWKVIPGRGYADSPEEYSYLQGMKRWAEKKSASSGKKWTVHLTGANVSEDLEEGWKDWVAGGALAAGLAFGGGAAHAQDVNPAQQAAPAVTAQAQQSTVGMYTPGVTHPAAYTINYKGQDYKFAGRDAQAPQGGEQVTVGAGAIGIRGLKPVNVILAADGQYYLPNAKTTESVDTPVAQKHRVGVAVIDAHHPAITQRSEAIQKFIRVTASTPEEAIQKASAYYKKSGYKVQDAWYIGVVAGEQ